MGDTHHTMKRPVMSASTWWPYFWRAPRARSTNTDSSVSSWIKKTDYTIQNVSVGFYTNLAKLNTTLAQMPRMAKFEMRYIIHDTLFMIRHYYSFIIIHALLFIHYYSWIIIHSLLFIHYYLCHYFFMSLLFITVFIMCHHHNNSWSFYTEISVEEYGTKQNYGTKIRIFANTLYVLHAMHEISSSTRESVSLLQMRDSHTQCVRLGRSALDVG